MRKVFVVLVLVASFLVTGCAKSKEIGGVEYKPYGLFNSDERKADSIQYEVSFGNVVWGVLLAETIFLPVYCFGFALHQPVSAK